VASITRASSARTYTTTFGIYATHQPMPNPIRNQTIPVKQPTRTVPTGNSPFTACTQT
jgi:hypothetical protein